MELIFPQSSNKVYIIYHVTSTDEEINAAKAKLMEYFGPKVTMRNEMFHVRQKKKTVSFETN